jgi:hypothetical protein
MEKFLATAKVVRVRNLSTGITNSQRATLSDGRLEHDAHIQSIDERKQSFQTALGTEINFRDSYKFNIAGYKLDRMLDLHMTPVSVERRVAGHTAAVTWWVDDVQMMEVDRFKKKLAPPDQDDWNRQMHIVRVFDQLIYNTDRNLQNLLICHHWNIWMIDHTRAFRLFTKVREPKNLTMCERGLLAKLRELNEAALKKELGHSLTPPEIRGLLGRRDHILQIFGDLITQKGEQAVLYQLARRPE